MYENTTGHIRSRNYNTVFRRTSVESGLYQVELCEILLTDLVEKSEYAPDNVIKEFKKRLVFVQDNKNKFMQYEEKSNTKNIDIRVSSLCLVRYIAKKMKISQETVIMTLLAESIINTDDFGAHVKNILNYYLYRYTFESRRQYLDFLHEVPGCKDRRGSRR